MPESGTDINFISQLRFWEREKEKKRDSRVTLDKAALLQQWYLPWGLQADLGETEARSPGKAPPQRDHPLVSFVPDPLLSER